MSLKHHPLDNPDFRIWLLSDCDVDTNLFAYGIYDSQWQELYDQWKEDTDYANITS